MPRRRVFAMEEFMKDAKANGGNVLCGGTRLDRPGSFFAPTVIAGLPDHAQLMLEEPFGPIAPIASFMELDEVVARANRLAFGLAAYVFSSSSKVTNVMARSIAAVMVTINHFELALPEIPFGGINDSGYGRKGGSETFDNYLNTKFITQMD